MPYQSVCPANPDQSRCKFDCHCTGHTKAWPNQDCICPQDDVRENERVTSSSRCSVSTTEGSSSSTKTKRGAAGD